MLSLIGRFRKNQRGAAAVEMAFILPLFLLFVVGLVEFARAYWTLNSMQLAIDEAGRYAMVHTSATDAQIVSTAQSNLYGLNSNNFTITSTSQTSGGVNYKIITATYVFNFVAPSLLPFGTINLTRQTEVPILP